eukprot:1992768-Rhodomonas_salina.1
MLLHSIVNLSAEVPVGKGIIQVLKLRGDRLARLNPFNPFAIEPGNVRFETQPQTVRLSFGIWVVGEKDFSPELRSTGRVRPAYRFALCVE